ncbi:MAG: fumarylacetoacetate hydrolase family protein [Planctomycetota bacterium]
MKFVTFRRAGDRRGRFGALVEGGRRILDFSHPAGDIPAPARDLDWFDLAGPYFQSASALLASALADDETFSELDRRGAIVDERQADLLAPVPRPGKIVAVGLNYRDHAEETGRPVPNRPVLFSKYPSCVVPSGHPIEIPADCERPDYEAELAVVIGRRGRAIRTEDALDHVLGYTMMNDVTARDFQAADGQFQRGKSCDTFAPMGPYIATTETVRDPQRLAIRLRLNGRVMQDANTSGMVFGVRELIAFISRYATLEPGDVIATGTPAGVGVARTPPVFLADGDHVEVEIESLGVLRNPVVRAD